MTEDIIEVLTEDMDEEILERMPVWFRMIREEYTKRIVRNS